MKPRILIITQKVDREDSLLGFFHYWIENVAKQADKVTVIALGKGVYSLPANVQVYSLGKERGTPKFMQAIKFYIYAFRALMECDGIFVHMVPEYVRAVWPLNVFFRRPVAMWYAHIHVGPAARWAIDHVDYVLTASKESFEFDSSKVVVTGHGIDTDLFKPDPLVKKEPLILTMSRISRVKRLDVFIKAIKLLKDRHKDMPIRALIAGRLARPEDAEYQRELKALIHLYGLDDVFGWYPEITNSEMPAIYNKAAVFVRMQGGGGFGKSELAAMSCGVPSVIPTDVYKKDLGEFAENTYFKEDDAEELALRIEGVLSWDTDTKSRYAKIARGIVVDKHNIEKLAKVIVSLLAKKP
ncbi:glycosyltransferase family 4 protein [Candidatus Parcubacteria bacterium]|nr:glycosyltransferase family 4 protein [Candidatus Parcubacteria bacterium]